MLFMNNSKSLFLKFDEIKNNNKKANIQKRNKSDKLALGFIELQRSNNNLKYEIEQKWMIIKNCQFFQKVGFVNVLIRFFC